MLRTHYLIFDLAAIDLYLHKRYAMIEQKHNKHICNQIKRLKKKRLQILSRYNGAVEVPYHSINVD